jgi:hypothetical protein
MKGFLKHWARLNAPFIVKVLRKVAQDLEHLVAGSPMMATPPIFTTEGETTMGMISVEDGSGPLSATVVFLDAEGNETTADDVPQWSSDNDAVASVEASEDGMTGTVTIVTPGAAIISVDTTNDDGTTVHSQGTVTVLPGNAVTGDVEFQAPEAPPEVNPL